MTRAEFSKATKRAALERSGGHCEAVGEWYGLGKGMRCNTVLGQMGQRIEFDHVILDANSHDNSLENCAVVCFPCHRWKSSKHDTPLAAKTQRQQDKARGIKKPSRSFVTNRSGKFKKKMSGEIVRR